MAAVRHVEFLKFRVCQVTCSHAILLHCAKFRSYNSIHSWDITISGLEKQTFNLRHLLLVSISTTSYSACHSASGSQISSKSDHPEWKRYYIDFQDGGYCGAILLPVSEWWRRSLQTVRERRLNNNKNVQSLCHRLAAMTWVVIWILSNHCRQYAITQSGFVVESIRHEFAKI